MSGMCYSCASRFGTFNKELGCKNCGFAFCKKCLTKKAAVPKLDNKSAPVCNKCYNILNGKTVGSNAGATFEPPDALLKRLAALEQGTANVVPVAAVSAKKPPKQRGLTSADKALVERLERLKEGQKAAPSQAEIESRLAKLKQDEKLADASVEANSSDYAPKSNGQDASAANQPFVLRLDRRSEQQQIDSLLQEICEEVTIDDRMAASSISDIQDRLNRLKSDGVAQNNLDESTVGSSQGPPTSAMNIPPSDPPICEEPSLSDIEKLMRDAAVEAHKEASLAIEGVKKDKELWNRVQHLKDARQAVEQHGDHNNMDVDNLDSSSVSSIDDGDVAVSRTVRQVLEENALDEKCNTGNTKTVSSIPQSPTAVSGSNARDTADDREDDLPWCCICNNDASLRCAGCDGDLYCQRCFREGHDRFEMKDHRTTRYSPARCCKTK